MPKMKKKKRARKTAKQSGASFWDHVSAMSARAMTAAAAGVSVVVAIIALILWSGGYFGLLGERINRSVKESVVAAGFEVRKISAKGAEHVSEDDLLAAVGPVIGSSMLHFDAYRARARIEDLGWVRSAAVSRLLPNTIHISVREREPAAVWQLSGALHLIDEHGAVIRTIDAFEFSNLPLIVGAGAPAAAADILGALRNEPAIWGEAAALIRVGDRRWNLRLKSGGDVKFPETNVARAVKDLAFLHDAYGVLDGQVEYIDLRDPEFLVYRRPGDQEESKLANSQ